MKVTDNRTITVEIDGTEHPLSLTEAQEMYDALGGVAGIRRHSTPTAIHHYPPGVRTPNSWPLVRFGESIPPPTQTNPGRIAVTCGPAEEGGT